MWFTNLTYNRGRDVSSGRNRREASICVVVVFFLGVNQSVYRPRGCSLPNLCPSRLPVPSLWEISKS